MKTFALYLIALLFSFEAFAYENAAVSTRNNDQQVFNAIDARSQQNVRQVSWTQSSSSIDTVEETTTEKRDKLLTSVLVYTLIILVYSFYWHKNNKPAD